MTPTHAGAVAFRESASGREYLVISSSTGGEWVLPKGHIERRESIAEAALRELLEESGVVGTIIAELQPLRFHRNGNEVNASILLVRTVAQQKIAERRTIEWLEYSEARKRLTFDDARAVLDDAEHILRDRCLRKIAFVTTELERQIAAFNKESVKHKQLYRWLRYPSIVMTACAGGLATLAITYRSSQQIFNLVIVGISAALTVLVAIEALRMPRDLWVHERNIYYALKDLLRELNYRSLEPSHDEAELDLIFDRLQSILGRSGEKWREFVRKQEKHSEESSMRAHASNSASTERARSGDHVGG